jgi:hypothetical protein
MTPFGSVEFNIEELPGELRVRYARNAGWIERILAPAAVTVLAVIGWFWQEPGPFMGACGLCLLLVMRWAWGHESVLRIFPDRLVFSSYFQNPKEVLLADIKTMQWSPREPLDEDRGPTGLYISCAGRAVCVLPFVRYGQAKAVTDAISKKFPEYPVNVTIPGSAFFGALPDMTALTIPNSTDLDRDKKS